MSESQTKVCQNCKGTFVIEPEEFAFYKKVQVPPPTWCSQCRFMRRFSWRNERALYKRKCDLCGEKTIAMYSPEKPYMVYCPDCFYSDKWDPLVYGRDYDFSKSFFLQFQELQRTIPQLALLQMNMVNSPWCNYEGDSKSCYLNFGGHQNEDSAYNQYGLKTHETLDTYWFKNGDFGYETTFSENCYREFFSKLCYECQDTYFSFDCRNCSNIFGCSGLRNKKYHIFNKLVSKEEFEEFMRKNWNGSYASLRELEHQSLASWRSWPQRATFVDRSVNSNGNLINECKNCTSCWLTDKTEDSRNMHFCLDVKDSQDITSVWGAELSYEVMGGVDGLARIKFSTGIIGGSNVEYSSLLFGSHNVFGCTNLRSKEYCILNKQYSKEEYFELMPKIREHMRTMPYIDTFGRTYAYGEYFPMDLSPFDYNETVAYEYFPFTKSDERVRGLRWNDSGGEQYAFSNYVVPDAITKVKDDIVEQVLKCEVSGKAYRIIPMELSFYRRFSLPIPRRAPFERHRERLHFIADHLSLHPR